jgi:hypothetical protein
MAVATWRQQIRRKNRYCSRCPYVNLLREKARQLEAEEKRLEAFGPAPSVRFVPFIMAARLPIRSVADRVDG